MLRRIFGSLFILGTFLILVLLTSGIAVKGQTKGNLAAPPVAPVKPVTTDYYGTKVLDPYRYMENLKDPKVQAWMKAQNDYTRAVLARIPGREKLLERFRQLDKSEPRVVRARRLPGNRYLILKQLPGDNVAKLYLRQGLDGKDKLLVDPGKIKLAPSDQTKGKNTIRYFAPTPNGKYVAVGITPGGEATNTELHVIDTASGGDTGDVIVHAFITHPGVQLVKVLIWLPDSHSFVYRHFGRRTPGRPVATVYQKIPTYLHVLGRDPAKDPAVFGYGVVPTIQVNPRYLAKVEVPPGSKFAIGTLNTGVAPNSTFFIEPVSDLSKAKSGWRKAADFSDEVGAATAPSIAIHGNDVYLLTYKNAPRYKVVRTDVRNPDLASAETVVPPSQAVVTGLHPAEDALYVELLDGGVNRLLRVPYGPRPKVEEVHLPYKGTLDVETDPRLPGALLRMQTWTRAYTIEAYDPKTNRVSDTKLQPTGPYDNPSDLESQELKVPSYDGTLVPLSVVHLKGLKLDGSHPTWLWGYGAYGFSIPPSFAPFLLTWYRRGGVLAACHVRGGGAYGEQWHLAGKGPTKPNTWKDFIACAQYLIQHKYTSPTHLGGTGVSAGGITIGRAIEARPDLFAAAIDQAGMADVLRSETMPNGVMNIPEFGSTKTEAGFNALYAMSPYAHVKPGTRYPAVLLMTGINDPNVIPWQMAKMAARLQAATSSGKPVLLRVDYTVGHAGSGATRADNEERWADQYSFLLWQLGAPGFQPE